MVWVRTWIGMALCGALLAACGQPHSGKVSSSGSPRTPIVLLDVAASGVKTTKRFATDPDWDLQWSYDCSNFGSQGNFILFVMNGDGTPSLENEGLNQLGQRQAATIHYRKGGTFFFKITSECNWHVTAKGVVPLPAPSASPAASPAAPPAATSAPVGP